MLGPSQLRRMRGSKLLGFLNLPVTSKRTLVHLRKHWDIVKLRRKRQLVEETVELMSTGRGPYNSHKPSCSKVEHNCCSVVYRLHRCCHYHFGVFRYTRFLNYKQCQSVAAISYTSASSLGQPFHITCISHPSWGPRTFKFDYYM